MEIIPPPLFKTLWLPCLRHNISRKVWIFPFHLGLFPWTESLDVWGDPEADDILRLRHQIKNINIIIIPPKIENIKVLIQKNIPPQKWPWRAARHWIGIDAPASIRLKTVPEIRPEPLSFVVVGRRVRVPIPLDLQSIVALRCGKTHCPANRPIQAPYPQIG